MDKSRYIQVAALIVISGLTFVAWIHLPRFMVTRIPIEDSHFSDAAKNKSACPEEAILCGVQASNSPDFNTLRSNFHSLVTTIDFVCPKTLRFGREGDGGYEACMAKAVRPDNNSCLVYSFGISRDWSFDEAWSKYGCEVHSFDPRISRDWSFDEAWSKYGCEVHSFDPSIGLGDHVHSPNVTFHNLGLWGNDYKNSNGWKLESFSSIKKRLGHKKRIIDALKVDVEGAEWPFLRDVIYTDPTSLSNVRQLYIELHTPKFRSVSTMTATDFAEINDYVRRLRDDLGFQLYKNVQRNNCCLRFSDLMPRGVSEKCCHELFFFNFNPLAA